MSSRSHERRSERATAEDVAEIERQLWAFSKRIDPPEVPEARLRPGAFLWRMHRTWHDLGRGTGGLASRSFRALRDELLRRDPPVRNLQPKLYGNTALSHADAEQLIEVMLESWHLERSKSGKWQANPLRDPDSKKLASNHNVETIRENLLHTLLRGDDQILLEEPVGVPPEVFYEQRGRTSEALIIPTKGETTAHFSPANAYGGFSAGIGQFFEAALSRNTDENKVPIVIWVLRLDTIRDNAEYHISFHSLAVYSACLANWFIRLSRDPKKRNQKLWKAIIKHSVFAVHGLPLWLTTPLNHEPNDENLYINSDLVDLGPNFFVPYTLPIVLKNHHQVKKHREYDYGVNVSVEPDTGGLLSAGERLRYWLFPDHPTNDVEETAETTGLPIFEAERSPGRDFDLAYSAVFEAASYKLKIATGREFETSLVTLHRMGWQLLTVEEFQRTLLISAHLAGQ